MNLEDDGDMVSEEKINNLKSGLIGIIENIVKGSKKIY